MTEMSKKDLKEMYFEMEKEADALMAKNRERQERRMAKMRETIRERNAYFMDKYWISLGNSTLQNDFLSRFVRKFRRRLYEQIELRSIGCGTSYEGDEISQFLQCDFALFFEMYQKKCEELKALCDAYAECFARLGIMSCDKPYVTFIKPVIFASNRKDLLVLCHYSNIQLMFKQLNHFKKLFGVQKTMLSGRKLYVCRMVIKEFS